MSGESFVDYLDASDDVFFIALGNVRVIIYSVATRVYEFSTLAVKNRIHAELLRLDTSASRWKACTPAYRLPRTCEGV